MDLQLAERESTLLGQEFLTWLWFAIEDRAGIFNDARGRAFAVHMENKVSVQGGEGDNTETATVSSPRGELTEALAGLRAGKKVHKAQLKFELDADAWQMTVKADDFALSGLKTPKVDKKDAEDEDPDGVFLEKLALMETCLGFLDALYAEFLKLRMGKAWADEAARIRDWVSTT